MLDHLLQAEYEPPTLARPEDGFTPLKNVSADQLLDAQVQTTEWLKELGAFDDEQILDKAQEENARHAFKAMVASPDQAKAALEKVQAPAAVRKIVGMLSAYDWQFVEQAQQLRGMAVAKIVEETDHPDARIRLKALELLGKVTEVGLFTDRIEIKKSELSNEDLDARIKEKLQALSKAMESHNTFSGETVDGELIELKPEATDAKAD